MRYLSTNEPTESNNISQVIRLFWRNGSKRK